jgi:hypothetical protein
MKTSKRSPKLLKPSLPAEPNWPLDNDPKRILTHYGGILKELYRVKHLLRQYYPGDKGLGAYRAWVKVMEAIDSMHTIKKPIEVKDKNQAWQI